MPHIYKARDSSDSFIIKKGILPQVPFRGLLIGRSGSGKSSILSNLIANPDFYEKDFDGEDIYIFTGSRGDIKMNNLIKYKEIPESNVFDGFQDHIVEELYETMVEEFNDAVENKRKPPQKLFILDDVFFSNQFRSESQKDSMLLKLFQNGRKYLASVLCLAQKASSIATPIRENSSFVITFPASNKQIELLESDYNYLPSKQDFIRIFKEATKDKHDFLFINMDAPLEKRYMDKNFNFLS